MECHRINGKIWVIQISSFIQIQDHPINHWKHFVPLKSPRSFKTCHSFRQPPHMTLRNALDYMTPTISHSPTCATYLSRGSFFAQEVESGGGSRNHSTDGRSTGSNFGPKLGTFLRHWTLGIRESTGVDVSAPFFSSVAPTQKRGGFFWGDNPKGWRSKWNGDFKGKVLSSNATNTSSVSYFCWLQANSNAQEVRRWKRLPLKSYKYVHESWSSYEKFKLWEKRKR